MQTITLRTAVLTLAAVCSLAQAEGETTIKLGAIRYDTHARTSGISGIGIPAGADATVGDASTMVFTVERALSDKWGLELVLGVPPKIKAQAAGTVAFLGEVLTARNVAPTLLLSYHFGEAGSMLRPYAGVGINYTRFTDVKTPYGWDVSLSDSWGPAAHMGLDLALNKQWGLWTSVGVAHVKSKLVATGAVVLQTTIDFRPTTYSLGASYRF